MKDGICPHCHSESVHALKNGLGFHLGWLRFPNMIHKLNKPSQPVHHVDYVCTSCGYFETYITDKNALSKIADRAEKLGDWKKAQ